MNIIGSTALNETRLRADIRKSTGVTPLKLLYLRSCESTNQECLTLSEHNTVVISEHQSAGRGRRGNTWHSPSAQNIYCSIGINKSIKAEYLGLISLQVGICLVSVLREKGVEGVSLKWPNDILLHGKKLGGILIETRAISTDNFFLVIGFGLNMNLKKSDLKHITQAAAGLNQSSNQSLDRQQLLVDIICKVLEDVLAFDLDSIDFLMGKFSEFDEMQGKQVRVKTVNGEITGLYLGIQHTGQIRVQTANGVELFSAAEISLREL